MNILEMCENMDICELFKQLEEEITENINYKHRELYG